MADEATPTPTPEPAPAPIAATVAAPTQQAPPVAPPVQAAPVAPPQPPPVAAAPAPIQPSSPVQQAPPSASPPAPQFNTESLNGLGIDPSKFETPQQLIDALAQQAREQQSALRFVSSQMQGRQPSAPATPPATPAEEWSVEKHLQSQWTIPQPDPQWAGLIKSGVVIQQDGEYVSANPANVWVDQFLPAMNNYETERRGYLQSYLENPLKKTYEALKDPVERMIDERVKQGISEAYQRERREQFVDSWFKENDKDLYAETRVNPMTGEETKVLTPWAQQIQDFCNELKDNGVTDVAKQLQLAMRAIPKATQATPPPPAAAAATPAPTPAPAPAPAPTTSWLQDTYVKAGNDGNGNGSPVRLPQGTDRPNLDTFFTDQMQRLAAGQ